MSKDRLVAFTDAVLAIIITILVLELPKPSSPSVDAILELKESFYAYTLSFFWLGALWFGMYKIWSMVEKVDNKVIIWNIVLLFFVSLIPYTTSLVSKYYDSSAIQALYGIVVILVTVSNVFLNKVIDEPNIANSELLKSTKQFRSALIIDGDVKAVGLLLTITVLPEAMMISVLIAGIYIMLIDNKLNKQKLKNRRRDVK